jgi:hypothetical protein
LTYARVGVKYKKLDISIPKLNDFIHKVYINAARVLYQQAYLFKQGISPIDIQKNNVTINQIIKESIIQSVRDSIPFDSIVRSYLDETHETFDDIKEESMPLPPKVGGSPSFEMKAYVNPPMPNPIVPPPAPPAKNIFEMIASKQPPTETALTVVNTRPMPDVMGYTGTDIVLHDPVDDLDGRELLNCIEL